MPPRPHHGRASGRIAAAARLAAPALTILAMALPHHRAAAEAPAPAIDRLAQLQTEQVDTNKDSRTRPYHFGAQGNGHGFSTHTSHSNRLVPVYAFGRKVDLASVMGKNSRYRTEEGVRSIFGFLPTKTVNPEADYADQSDLYRVQKDAAARGAKHIITIWFDGTDWETTQAAAIARTGKVYTEGKGTGLAFQDETADGSAQYGYVVTTPTHTDPKDEQVSVEGLVKGGYDVRFAGATPWAPGALLKQGPGYLKGPSGTKEEKAAVLKAGGAIHSYTDSSCSAAEYACGVKSFNNGVNVGPDGAFVPTLYNQLQAQGWRVGTVTSVPFNHASPAGMYAHNVSRDDYQDLARDMLGLEAIGYKTGKDPKHPGLDVVIGAGWGNEGRDVDYTKQGANAFHGKNMFLAEPDLAAIDVKNGGPYVVSIRESGVDGRERMAAAAKDAATSGKRLFGFYGLPKSSHIPFSTADGDFKPVKSISGVAEKYSAEDLQENPRLADMARAALEVLGSTPDKPFALFIEAGDVDFALHANNLDNAVGAVFDGEAAFQVVVDWVNTHSNWDDTVVIVTSDHGHYLVLDDPSAIAGTAKDRPAPRPAQATAHGN
jgi:alkaline phosphatase